MDTATAATSVALRLEDGRTEQARDDPPAGAHPGHATRLLSMAGALLDACGLTWDRLERVAVGVGPGTFTGLRVGIATARGLAQSLGLELVGISSLLALAAGSGGHGQGARGLRPVLAAIDARRGEVFAAAYLAGGGGAPRELVAPRALAPAELPEMLAAAQREGAPARGWVALGDGALRYVEHLRRPGVSLPEEGSPLHRVGAEWICELAAGAPAPASVEAIVPDYQRRPDAEIALDVVAAGRPDQP